MDFASRTIAPILQLVFWGTKGLIFAPYGDAWRQLHKICTLELLNACRVHSFHPVREDEVARLLCRVASAAAAGLPMILSERC